VPAVRDQYGEVVGGRDEPNPEDGGWAGGLRGDPPRGVRAGVAGGRGGGRKPDWDDDWSGAGSALQRIGREDVAPEGSPARAGRRSVVAPSTREAGGGAAGGVGDPGAVRRAGAMDRLKSMQAARATASREGRGGGDSRGGAGLGGGVGEEAQSPAPRPVAGRRAVAPLATAPAAARRLAPRKPAWNDRVDDDAGGFGDPAPAPAKPEVGAGGGGGYRAKPPTRARLPPPPRGGAAVDLDNTPIPNTGKAGATTKRGGLFGRGAPAPTATEAPIDPTTGAAIPERATVRLAPCRQCGRSFGEEALQRHSRVCKGKNAPRRPIFDAKAQALPPEAQQVKRSEGPPLRRGPGAGRAPPRIPGRAPAASGADCKSAKWRQQSQGLRQAMAASRKVNAKIARGEPLGPSEAGPPDPSLVQCRHCGRRFNERAHERHEPQCQNIRAQPKFLARGSGAPPHSSRAKGARGGGGWG